MLHLKQFLGVKLEENVDTTEWHDDKIKISRHSLIINKIIKSATLKSFLNQKDFSSNLFINVGMYIILLNVSSYTYHLWGTGPLEHS